MMMWSYQVCSIYLRSLIVKGNLNENFFVRGRLWNLVKIFLYRGGLYLFEDMGRSYWNGGRCLREKDRIMQGVDFEREQ